MVQEVMQASHAQEFVELWSGFVFDRTETYWYDLSYMMF